MTTMTSPGFTFTVPRAGMAFAHTVDEQAFRFNNRLPFSDKDRFSYLVRKIIGKRLTY